MQKKMKYSLLLLGLIVGAIHLRLALKAMFVFRNEESVAMWVFVLFGPLTTLPAVIIAFFWSRTGGGWLIFGAIVSFVAYLVSMESITIFQEIVWYSGPMLVLGAAALLAYRLGEIPGT